MKFLSILLLSFFSIFFTSCYSIKQSYYQIKLLMSEVPLSIAIEKNKEKADRLAKLNLVKPVLEYAQEQVNLTPKNSYQTFIELNSPYIVWVVQAANKRSLNLNTWWFPVVGEQPYLGFFNQQDALSKAKKLKEQNYDVTIGGVKAFSLLGYFADPIYSSMVDGVSIPAFIETLIHETVHRTIYVKGNYSFNENLANFVARKATSDFLKFHPELGFNFVKYKLEYEKKEKLQQKFNIFLMKIKKDLDEFYKDANINPKFKNEDEFLKIRENKFDEISKNYLTFMTDEVKGTNYEFAFSKGKLNNAVILSYSVYEENQQLLEDIFSKANFNLKNMVDILKKCLVSKKENGEKIWQTISACFN